MMKAIFVMLLCLVSLTSFAQQVVQVGPTSISTAPLTSTGFGSAFDTSFPLPDKVTLTAVVTGAPTTCTFGLYGTIKRIGDPTIADNDYVPLGTAVACDGTAAANGTASQFLVDKMVRTVKAKLISLAGGTSPGISFTIMYRGER